MNKQNLVYSSIERLKKSGFRGIRAKVSGYDEPEMIHHKQEDESFTPDIVADHSNGTYVFEVVHTTSVKKERVKERWQAFSKYAYDRKGRLYLVIPEGNRDFLKKLLSEFDLLGARLLQISTR